ncbi:MAG: ABC transporter ATP-binding protein [Hadesarchaea archaeon DG-33-1]|nr:MAG: ABC transporter ATP-binding protein [Hadesarchaea archaeon DG-33-1]
MPAIATNGLTRKFGDLVAVDHINLLGPNGAGKTTFIHMLSTVLPPTEGTAKVAGFDIRKTPDAVRTAIGIVFQDPSLDNRLTGRENLDFHGRMYGLTKEQRDKRINKVLELVGLRDRADSFVETYSSGMRRRLEMARGLMHRPKILFLDEPTLGLDPQTRRSIWEYIQTLNKTENVTVILTTHYMEEADYLCDRVGIIDHGKIIALDEPETLKDKLKGDIVSLKVQQPEKYIGIFQKNKFVGEVKVVEDLLHLRVSNGEKLTPKLMELIRKRGGRVQAVSLRRPTLEDVFILHTGRAIREEEVKPSETRWRMMARTRR